MRRIIDNGKTKSLSEIPVFKKPSFKKKIKSCKKRKEKRKKTKRERKYNESGYILTRDNRLLHRVISEKYDGPIPKGWHVHHCDCNKYNNKRSNLVQIPSSLHWKIHEIPFKDLPNKDYILLVILPEFLKKEAKWNTLNT